MRLLVWNVKGFLGAPLDKVRSVTARYSPDIVCLQEVWDPFTHAYLATGWSTAKWATTRWWWPWFQTPTGLSFLARERWRQKVWRFGAAEQTSFDDKANFLIVRGAQVLTRKGLTLIHTHMNAGGKKGNFSARKFEVAEIIRKARRIEGPLVIVGDLNLRPTKRDEDQELLVHLRRSLGIQHLVTGPTELDYVLARGIKLTGAMVSGHRASDHDPLLVEIG